MVKLAESVEANYYQMLLFKISDCMSMIGHLYFKHCANMPMQYTAIFHGCKNGNFQVTKCYIFLIFAHNMDCGYTLVLH